MPLQPTTTTHLDHVLATAQREARLPSVVAGLVREGQLVWSGAAGAVDGRSGSPTPDVDTQYRMGSITKTFVAVAVLRLRDAGRLDLSDRFDDHVPGTPFGMASIEQLLTHSGGVQAETSGPWWERTSGGDWGALMAEPVEARFRAGRRFHYSNVGYAGLGRLLELHHGRGWFDVVREELLEPLGMQRTTLRPTGPAAPGLAVHPFADVLLPEPEHDAGAMGPAGQLWTTVADLARWAGFLAGHTAGVLSADTLAEMLEPHHVVDEPGQPWVAAHGLGFSVWNEEGVRYAGHGGSMPGFLALLAVHLEGGDGVVVLTNTTASTVTGGLTRDLLRGLAERDPRTPEAWTAGGDPSLLELVGTWHWGAATQTARVDGEHLVLGEPGAARGSRFRRVAADEWVGLDSYFAGEPMRVVRRANGTVSHLDVASFRLSRTPYDPEADVPGGVDEAGWA